MTILLSELKRSIVSLSIWMVCVFLFMLLVASVYPSISQTEGVQELLNNIENADVVFAAADLSSPEGWLNTEFFGLLVPIIMMVIAVGSGSSTIKSEQESGTLELLLSRPIPRWNILAQKAGVIEAKLILVAIALFIGVFTGTRLISEFSVTMDMVFWALLNLILLILPFAYGALAITTLGGSKALARGSMIIVFVTTHFINTLSSSIDWIEPLQPLSPQYYYQSLDVLQNGPRFGDMGVLLILTLCVYALAHIGFIRRDANG